MFDEYREQLRSDVHARLARTDALDPETSERVSLFNPRTQVWHEHFQFAAYQVLGLTAAGRATALALKEAYRPVNVREGDKVVTLPAIQAVLRSQVAIAAKGNGPAQRTVIETIQAIEREIEAHVAAKERALADTSAMSDLEVARRIAFLLTRASKKIELNE